MRFYYDNKLKLKDLNLQNQTEHHAHIDLGRAGKHIVTYEITYLGRKNYHSYEIQAKSNILYSVLILSGILACVIAILVDRLEVLYYLPFLILIEFIIVRAALRSKIRTDLDKLLEKQYA
ncbi:hypothetical protein SAMN05216474_0194 [Lishizhenia tianjinensis]|uniref:Uncharacterized protein n=1 Tax=Lishizhenia tianjinensis TaxID=477690 RepID=A0A1I6XHP1_9FLAO|nr:hypothetical protein [Lishizhenia tianjinensis]SFT37561.1 hypothetical protein SAMN05216474_0194 [Lishizhenia tianjinensis]